MIAAPPRSTIPSPADTPGILDEHAPSLTLEGCSFMPAPEDVTVGELMRRLDEFGRRVEVRLDEFMRRMETMTREQAERDARLSVIYLPRNEYRLAQETDQQRRALDDAQARGLENEVHKVVKRLEQQEKDRNEAAREDERWRKQVRLSLVAAFVAPLLILLLSTLLQARALT